MRRHVTDHHEDHDDEEVDQKRHERRHGRGDRNDDRREPDATQDRSTRDDRRKRCGDCIGDKGPEDDPEDQIQRILVQAGLEDASKHDPEHREVEERLGERPEVAEHRTGVLELEIGPREHPEDSSLVQEALAKRRLGCDIYRWCHRPSLSLSRALGRRAGYPRTENYGSRRAIRCAYRSAG